MYAPLSPSLGRMSLTALWLESIVYGINCVLFGGCLYVLSIRRKTHRILLVSSVFHIFISTAHAILSLIQLLKAFSDNSIVLQPHGSDMYLSLPNAIMISNLVLYVSNVFVQDLLLIWKLFVVWGHCWKLIILPLIVEVAHIACAVLSIAFIAQPGAHLFSPNVQAFGKASWSLDLLLNTTVTAGIAYRLWTADRQTHAIDDHHPYKATMLAVIESGALIATCTIVMFALDIAGSPAGLVAVNVAVQLATTTPLLIIVRLGLGLTSRDSPPQQRMIKTSNNFLHCKQAMETFTDSTSYPMHSVAGHGRGKDGINSFFESRDMVALDYV
ncbi:hypothetical protein BJ138DRAFT_1129193 [Hygrophoropsis aurantiaca]|uniref:Uncharacterized protein n=1 Tax=Hygrophoropsis aurantiaca TaxID=72124 RepID=A0ACB8A1W2_9AGAM|nr:hypothetical protein BJ138DRAFT_1129193 [Hygrophoropsis aurantiaca]